MDSLCNVGDFGFLGVRVFEYEFDFFLFVKLGDFSVFYMFLLNGVLY